MSALKLLSGRKSVPTIDPVNTLISGVSAITSQRSMSDESIGQMAISTESLDNNSEQQLTSAYNSIESNIKAIAQNLNISVEGYQVEAGAIAGIVGTSPAKFLANKPRITQPNAVVMATGLADGFSDRPTLSTEAYDERDNRNSQLYSIVYNLLASRQDDFGETFFPTIVVNPNEVGVTICAKLFYVYNDFKRSANGSLANYGRMNIIRAYSDAEVLRNELTRAVPVLRTGGADDSTAMFVPVATIPAWSESLSRTATVTTGAIKVDTKVDLIGLSQTNELLASGLMGPSDSLDTSIKLQSVYVRIVDGANTSIVRINTEDMPSAVFTFAPQGNSRRMILSLDTDGVVFSPATTDIAGVAPAALVEAATNKIRVQLNMNGSVVLDKGDCIVNRGSLSLVAMRNASDLLVTGAAFDTLAAKLAAAEVLGYTLVAFRANSNIRQRGQLMDTQQEYRVVQVQYRPPMGYILPAINSNNDDNSALQSLINGTSTRLCNDAVTALQKAQTLLSSYVGVADANGRLPEIMTFGDMYVKPTYFTDTINLPLVVDSKSSHERLKDIRAALVEKVRYYANEMYRASDYKAAAAVLTGNLNFKPTVIIGTDLVIANYLSTDGDVRLLGDTFDVRIVSTQDARVNGKMYISFGVFDATRNTSINPLNFGNMLWSPELTVTMPVSRDGQVSKELIVAPRYYHNAILPIMTMLNVSGLPTATNKIATNFHTV